MVGVVAILAYLMDLCWTYGGTLGDGIHQWWGGAQKIENHQFLFRSPGRAIFQDPSRCAVHLDMIWNNSPNGPSARFHDPLLKNNQCGRAQLAVAAFRSDWLWSTFWMTNLKRLLVFQCCASTVDSWWIIMVLMVIMSHTEFARRGVVLAGWKRVVQICILGPGQCLLINDISLELDCSISSAFHVFKILSI